MKAALRLIPLFAFICMMAPAHAADLSGAWKGSFDFNGQSFPLTMNLKADGVTVTGTIEGLPTSPVDIHDGKIAADTVTFWTNTDYQGQTYKLIFTGKVNGEQIDFNFGTDDGTWGTTLTAKREGAETPATPTAQAAASAQAPDAASGSSMPDITGFWKGDFDFNGNTVPLTFNLQSKGAAVTGNIAGVSPAPIEIHDGKIAGDTVTFWINADYQGQTYTVNYTGKISPGQIDFSFGTSDGSWSTTMIAKKSPPSPATPEK